MKPLHGVRRTPEGFVPYCRPCNYEGEPRDHAHVAEGALRQHRASPPHRREFRRATLGNSRT